MNEVLRFICKYTHTVWVSKLIIVQVYVSLNNNSPLQVSYPLWYLEGPPFRIYKVLTVKVKVLLLGFVLNGYWNKQEFVQFHYKCNLKNYTSRNDHMIVTELEKQAVAEFNLNSIFQMYKMSCGNFNTWFLMHYTIFFKTNDLYLRWI